MTRKARVQRTQEEKWEIVVEGLRARGFGDGATGRKRGKSPSLRASPGQGLPHARGVETDWIRSSAPPQPSKLGCRFSTKVRRSRSRDQDCS